MKRALLVLALLAIGVSARAAGTTYYISLTGSDTTGDGSSGTPVRTATKAYTLDGLGGGGNVYIFKDGSYSMNISSPPWGTTNRWTVLKAETDRGVTMTNSSWLNQTDVGNKYLQYEGFVSSGTFQKNVLGSRQKFLRCTFYGGASGSNGIGMALGGVGQPATYILIEDSYFFGPNGRYNLLVYNGDHVIVRRVVIRHDGEWTSGGNPEAAYTVYSSSFVLSQNVFVVSSTGPFTQWSQAGYNVNAGGYNNDNKWQGCAFIKNEGVGLIIDADAEDHVIENTVFWDNQNGCMSFGNSTSSVTVRNVTCGRSSLSPSGDFKGGFGAFNDVTGSTFRDIIVTGWTDGPDFDGTTAPTYFNTFNNSGTTGSGTGRQTYSPFTNGLEHLARIESDGALYTAGSGGGIMGATLKQYGVSGTLYGDTGYDSIVDDSVLPLSFESSLKAAFTAYKPRDFALVGSTVSFTQWIYEYLGNACPAEICGVDVTSPTTVSPQPSTTSVTSSAITWNWNAATDATGVTSYEIDVDDDSGFGSPVSGFNDQDIGLVTSYQVTGLSASTTYYIRVRAKDAAGNTGTSSATGQGTTSAAATPSTGRSSITGVRISGGLR